MIPAATNMGGAKGRTPRTTSAARMPSDKPTTGNQGTLRARSSSAVPQSPGIGKIVRNRIAANKGFIDHKVS